MNENIKHRQDKVDESFPSPTSVILSLSSIPLSKHDNNFMDDEFELLTPTYHINLEQFIKLLPDTIRNSESLSSETICTNDITLSSEKSWNDRDPIGSLFSRLFITKEELKQYTFIDKGKNYTRNLIATDDETFTLLLLCWNPGKYSPIHDHPCDGCWMRVCQGVINEVQYQKIEKMKEKGSEGFICMKDTKFNEGDLTFMHDNIGYHKVGNPSGQMAISMHLYCPPFQKCKIWMDECNTSRCSVSRMCNFSEYGNLITKK